MATFASPVPRRTHRHATPNPSSRTPPRTRRFVGAHRAPPATPPGLVAESGMEVDEAPTHAHTLAEKTSSQKDLTFAKTEELVAGLYGTLPVEVKQALRSAGAPLPPVLQSNFSLLLDFLVESYTGCVDITSGYTLVASAKTCFLWSHATLRPTSPSPTCYILPCPPPSPGHPNVASPAPHHAIVPSRSRSIEPGLILVSPTGATRFWPSISSGLSGGGTFEAVDIPLEAIKEEYVSCVVRTNLGGSGGVSGGTFAYLVATSTGKVFRLGITSQGGKYTITVRLFAPPTSSTLSLSRLLGWSAPSLAVRPQPGNIVALASSGNDLFALVETRIQKWTLGNEVLTGETDVTGVVREAIGGGRGVEDLEGIDLAVER